MVRPKKPQPAPYPARNCDTHHLGDWLAQQAQQDTLRFITWDTSDTLLDSIVLLDNFRWSATPSNGPITQ